MSQITFLDRSECHTKILDRSEHHKSLLLIDLNATEKFSWYFSMPPITFIDRSKATDHFSCSTPACMRTQRPTSILCMYGGVCHNAQSISLYKSWSDVTCMCMTVYWQSWLIFSVQTSVDNFIFPSFFLFFFNRLFRILDMYLCQTFFFLFWTM